MCHVGAYITCSSCIPRCGLFIINKAVVLENLIALPIALWIHQTNQFFVLVVQKALRKREDC